jgi:hypothetical protein
MMCNSFFAIDLSEIVIAFAGAAKKAAKAR